ncbi:MAG: TonB-dependent receptor [Woeseiaceae bacterium]
MKIRISAPGLIAAGGLLAASNAAAEREDEHHLLDEIIVSATPLERTVEQLAQPTSVISGDALIRNQSASIGETLADQPGVSATYFGPVASRPVIRGQFGERVRMLSNGLDALDASALSEDHAVSIDSILADRVEIVRGPATLLYGSGAAGGLVNIVDSRIHEQALDKAFSGALSFGTESATGRNSAAGKVDIGDDTIALHFDFFERETDDIEIPGFVESEVLRNIEQEEDGEFGIVENTDSSTSGNALAFSWAGGNGFVGFALSNYDSNYGIPGHREEDEGPGAEEEEESVRIDLDQRRYDLNGRFGFDSVIKSVRFRIARNDYTHTELEGEEIGTLFDTLGTDARFEFRHKPVGRLEGAIGLQYKLIDFSAQGDDAFVPPSDTEQVSVFAFEELTLSDNWVLQASARVEQQDLTAPSLPSYDDTALGASIGAIWSPRDSLSLSAYLSVTERHPNSTELYADGPHIAVQRFERGSIAAGNGVLEKERSQNLDVTIRSQFERAEVNLTGFVNNIDDYILLRPTIDVIGEFQVFEYEQSDVEMYGIEAEALIDIFENGHGHLHARLSTDFVDAEESNGASLPRIPPWRYGLGLHYTLDRFEANIEAIRHDSQDDIAVNELPTDGYTLVSAGVSLRFADEKLLTYIKGTNLGDVDARRHASPLKDLVPLPGRSLHLGLRWNF